MKMKMTRLATVTTLVAAFGYAGCLTSARAADEPAESAPRDASGYEAWKPRTLDRAAYRDIVDYNIFRSDRQRLADAVDRNRNPQPPSVRPTHTEPVRAEDPPHPDSYWRLTGITHDAEGPAAYLENTKTNKLTVLRGPAEVGTGEITSIGYEKVVYVSEGEQRAIAVGYTLLGERVRPTDSGTRSSASGSSGSSSSRGSSSEASRAAALQALRERRARELGETPPEPEKPTEGDKPEGAAPAAPQGNNAPAENTNDIDPDTDDDNPINRVIGNDSRDGDDTDQPQGQP